MHCLIGEVPCYRCVDLHPKSGKKTVRGLQQRLKGQEAEWVK